MALPTSSLRVLRAFATALACVIGASTGAAPALAASEVVPATTMKALLGARFPDYDQREGLLSPDRTHILYRGREATPADVSSDQAAYRRAGDYYVLRADGSQVVKLSSVTRVPDSGVKVNSGVWSPDGRRIAFIRDASTRTDRDRKTVQTSVLSTAGGTDRWTTTTEGEAVTAVSFTSDSRYLLWEEHVSSIFTVDTMGLELANGRAFRLRWRPDPAPTPDPGWTWAGECDTAAILRAVLPPTALRLPATTTPDPQNDALAALTGITPACYSPATAPASTGDGAPLPTPTSQATAEPTPTPSGTPATPSPTATPDPGATPTPAPTPNTTAPSDTTEVPAGQVRVNGPGAGTLTPVDTAIQSDAVPISETLQAGDATLGGPSIAIRAVGKRLRGAHPKGVKVNYASRGARTVKAWLLLDASTGGGKPLTLSRLTISKPVAGTASLRLRLGKAARTALARAKSRTVIVRLVATNPAGLSTTVEQRVTLG